MIKFVGFLLFICNAGIVLGSYREFGHPIFRTFSAHDYGEPGEAYTVASDNQGRMLFGRHNEIATFDNSRWQTIAAPEMGVIRSLAVDGRGTVWFASSTEIGCLSEVSGVFRVVKIADGAFGVFPKIVTTGDGLCRYAGQPFALEKPTFFSVVLALRFDQYNFSDSRSWQDYRRRSKRFHLMEEELFEILRRQLGVKWVYAGRP
ncbi:MAG: hypothetical protein JOZ31_15565 [Verrucomicrobia bacterium]|nr:hypothetical protein [Verrucomicrobiota bacterium]MBV8482652.1 hypothetical protein [Verrucomicrobiota bacterium]